MAQQHCCPNCGASIQPLRRTNDFFCRACFTSLVVIEERWVQMLRVSDKFPQTLPLACLLPAPAVEPPRPPEKPARPGMTSRT